MYVLYLDDAGSVLNHNERHFILGGVALFERHIFHLNEALETFVEGLGLPDPSSLELHGNAIMARRKRWRALGNTQRAREVLAGALRCSAALKGNWVLFGVAVDKAAVSPRDPVEFAFEQLCSRFDHYIARHKRDGNNQRGLVVLDRSTRETRLQQLATDFRTSGHSWGKMRWICEVPLFVDSQATRLIQFADLVTYAIWRRFEKNDGEFFDLIGRRFDSEGGVVHGFLHERYAASQCDCPYCASRRDRA